MQPIMLLLIAVLLMFHHPSFSSSDDFIEIVFFPDNYITNFLEKQEKSIIMIEPSSIKFEQLNFSQYHNIFEKPWTKKPLYMGELDMSYKPDCVKRNWFQDVKTYLAQKDLQKNYYFLRWIANEFIIKNITNLDITYATELVDLCIKNKIHFITSLDIQKSSKRNRRNCIQKALEKAKKKLQDSMKINIATFIEQYDSNQQQSVLSKKNVEKMTRLYEIAIKLHNLHGKKFKPNYFKYDSTENEILETFFPHLYVLIKNIRKNPSLTTKYDENFDGLHAISF
jgi:hypothetical protein